MKKLMGELHRRTVLSCIPAGGRYLEWGAGGSTIWLDENLPSGVEAISIEHDHRWADSIRRVVKKIKIISVVGRAGRNATIDEEDPTELHDYIHAADNLGKFDCILIDGVARTSCGIAAQNLLKDNGTIFLHDANRWWYDGVKAIYDEIEIIPQCRDYPGPTLWRGRKKRIGVYSPIKQNNVMVHINQVFWRGGTNLFMMDMAKAFPEFRHIDLYLYDGREDYGLMSEFEAYGIEVSRIEMVTEKLLRDINPAILVFHNTPAELRGRKIVEGSWPFDWLKQWPLIAIHHNPSYPAFNAVLDVFVSQNVLDRYKNCISRMNWKLIPPCIDLSEYSAITRSPENNKCVIGKLTSNSPARYPIELLYTLEEVQRREPHINFSLVGAADHWKSIKLNNYETPPTGSRDTVAFYSMFDIFVHRNQEGTTDSWGRIISEAMASGLPVVTENRGGPAEQIEHGVDGFLCNTDVEFIEYLVRLVRDPSLRYNIGMKAREKALREFGIDRFRRETIGAIMKSIMGVA